MSGLDDAGLDLLFRSARSRNGWLDKPTSEATIRAIFELVRWAPTAANTNPARFVFVPSQAAKERLAPHLLAGNLEKTMAAPCCVIVAYDTRFYDLMPKLFPSRDMRAAFVGNDALIEETARRNGTLQGAYLIIAARALGLDCGAMSGFDNAKVDEAFFPDGRFKSNFLCNIGYGDPTKLFARSRRLTFEDACISQGNRQV
mgnify:CR=1 FL=1